ncbi:hypothetical protein BaRGS_00014635 [Batillaria attramentaria]|uniref:Uncharacterized protein n=1 Tax=Batillaria attramentaria TaxID=370345 RepID=A0ABD0L423_9CAEN
MERLSAQCMYGLHTRCEEGGVTERGRKVGRYKGVLQHSTTPLSGERPPHQRPRQMTVSPLVHSSTCPKAGTIESFSSPGKPFTGRGGPGYHSGLGLQGQVTLDNLPGMIGSLVRLKRDVTKVVRLICFTDI